MNCQSLNCCTYLQIILHNIIREYVLSLTFSMSNGARVSTVHYLHSRGKTTTLSMVSHRGHNCISSALTILDSALTS